MNGDIGSEDWVQKAKQATFTFCMRKSVSNSTESAFRMDSFLPKAFKMHKVIECIFNTEHRSKWELQTVVYDRKPRVADANCLVYEVYSLGKGMMGFSARDFLEKGISLWDG